MSAGQLPFFKKIIMENKNLTTVALRYRAIYLDIHREDIDMSSTATVPVMAFVGKLKANGFCVSEELLHALNATPTDRLVQITNCIDTVMRVKLNWAPLVKGWDVPTGEDYTDHLITLFVKLNGKKSKVKGTELPCGHLIPDGTFPIERYNGCPFCGTQFETADFVHTGQASKLKELRLFTRSDMQRVLLSLLQSPTPLDGTQSDSLKQLLAVLPLPADVKKNSYERNSDAGGKVSGGAGSSRPSRHAAKNPRRRVAILVVRKNGICPNYRTTYPCSSCPTFVLSYMGPSGQASRSRCGHERKTKT